MPSGGQAGPVGALWAAEAIGSPGSETGLCAPGSVCRFAQLIKLIEELGQGRGRAGSTRPGADVSRSEPLSQLIVVLRRWALSAPRGGVLPGSPGLGFLCPGETGVGLPPSLGLHGAGWG